MTKLRRKFLEAMPPILAAATALAYFGSSAYSRPAAPGPILRAATRLATPPSGSVSSAFSSTFAGAAHFTNRSPEVEAGTEHAVAALASKVGQLSHPNALTDAFESYFAFKAAHANEVRKPYLYFVDYGLPSTTPRGYVFDMNALEIVDGPFMVAHGRGSAANAKGIPTRFSNAFGTRPLTIGDVHAGVQLSGAELVHGSNRAVLFGGSIERAFRRRFPDRAGSDPPPS